MWSWSLVVSCPMMQRWGKQFLRMGAKKSISNTSRDVGHMHSSHVNKLAPHMPWLVLLLMGWDGPHDGLAGPLVHHCAQISPHHPPQFTPSDHSKLTGTQQETIIWPPMVPTLLTSRGPCKDARDTGNNATALKPLRRCWTTNAPSTLPYMSPSISPFFTHVFPVLISPH